MDFCWSCLLRGGGWAPHQKATTKNRVQGHGEFRLPRGSDRFRLSMEDPAPPLEKSGLQIWRSGHSLLFRVLYPILSYVSIYLSIYLPTYLSIYLPTYLSYLCELTLVQVVAIPSTGLAIVVLTLEAGEQHNFAICSTPTTPRGASNAFFSGRASLTPFQLQQIDREVILA